MLGIMNGMVMQRNRNNVADITVTSDTKISSAKYQGETSGENIKGAYLYYGFGLNLYCNITDQRNREMLCFGPIQII